MSFFGTCRICGGNTMDGWCHGTCPQSADASTPPASEHPNIDEINAEVIRFKKLLDDPHPESVMWKLWFYREATSLRNLLNQYVEPA